MRSRIIMHNPEPGSGAAQYVANLSEALAGSGEQVVLFCPANFAYLPKTLAAGVQVAFAGDRSTAPGGFVARIARNLRFLIGSFVRQARITQPHDIIHFHFPLYFPVGIVFFLLAKLQARAIVFTAHDPVPHKWLLPPMLRRVERGCLHLAYSLSDRIVVHNEAGRDLLIRTFSQPPGKIAIVPHGIVATGSEDAVFGNTKTLELLMFGSIREDKGVELAIEAVKQVNANGIKVRLLIAGSVANAREQSYWNECKRSFEGADCGIKTVERFVADEDIAPLMAACHAVLLPYKNFQSESGVAAVALAHGRPILATNTGSFAALLAEADLGIAIEAPCGASVERAIRTALAVGLSELRAKGSRGLDLARASRSWRSVARQTAAIYADISAHPEGNTEMKTTAATYACHEGRPRKVMMVSSSIGFGGADTQIVSIARNLRARGWAVTVVSMIPPAAHLDALAAIGVPVHSLGMKPGLPDPRAIARLARLIRSEKPDVVHGHMFHANLLCRIARCFVCMPVLVCTAHNTREVSQKGGTTWHKELLYRLTDRLADQTTIICQAGYRHYVRTKAVPEARLKLIPIGIDCARFVPAAEKRAQARRDLGLADDCFTFLTIGRMAAQKDYPNLLRAFSLLPPANWTLLIAGNGPLQSELEQLREDLALTGRVRFLGVRQDVCDWYQAADAFVMGSAVEGMPVVLLEAAASALPAVVTDAGGNGEVVVTGKTGLVVPKQDHVALSRALQQMLDMTPEGRAEFALAARARATEEFEIGRIVSRWEALYEDCLAASSKLSSGARFAPSSSAALR